MGTAVPGPVQGIKLFFAREALIVLSPRMEGVNLRRIAGDAEVLLTY